MKRLKLFYCEQQILVLNNELIGYFKDNSNNTVNTLVDTTVI